MYYNFVWSISLRVIVDFLLIGNSLAAYHYPRDPDTMKPCARRKNTMQYQGGEGGPVCVWDEAAKSYTPQSVTNCDHFLRAECPEFNEGMCEKYNEKHCCKLRYKALRKTWMEVFYENQYDAFYKVDAVFERHRMIRDEYIENFGNTSQPDYPENALDPLGERSLLYRKVLNPKKPPFPTDRPLCLDLKNGDSRCGDGDNSSYKYLIDNYAQGFEPENNKIPRTQYENDTQARIKITYESKCRNILLNKTRTSSCTTYYRRIGLPADNTSVITSFIFLEAQMVVDPLDTEGKFKLWFAYWYLEDPVSRDIIFKDKKRFMGHVSDKQLGG